MNICSGDIVENMRNNICKSQNMTQKDLSAKTEFVPMPTKNKM